MKPPLPQHRARDKYKKSYLLSLAKVHRCAKVLLAKGIEVLEFLKILARFYFISHQDYSFCEVHFEAEGREGETLSEWGAVRIAFQHALFREGEVLLYMFPGW